MASRYGRYVRPCGCWPRSTSSGARPPRRRRRRRSATPAGSSATTSTRSPMSDGGEGLLDVLGGANRSTIVTGPLGAPVEAAWRLDRRTAVIEMARASGLALAGGADGNDPLGASTAGTGELIDRALEQGARRDHRRPRRVGDDRRRARRHRGAAAARPGCARVELEVACDVRTRFVDAAAVFAPQKGASPAQVDLLTARLEQLAARYRDRVRRRRHRARRRRRRRRARRRARRPRRPPRRRVRPRRRARRAWTSASRPPTSSSPARATSTPRASTARSSAACASWPRAAGRPVVVDRRRRRRRRRRRARRRRPDVTVVSLIERYGERRALTRTPLVHRARRRRRRSECLSRREC